MDEVRPVLRPKAAARRAYDRMSAVYDWLTAGEAYMRNRLLRVAAARPGERVLDLGTGTGSSLRRLSDDVDVGGLVVGLDLSSGMLRRARRRIGGSAVDRQIGLVQGDAAALPLRPDAFDVVVMSFSLELFDTPEIPAVLDGCRRVMRTDGRLVIGCLATRPKRNLMVRLYQWLHDRYPEWLDCRPIPVRVFLAEAGFAVERFVEGSLWGLPVDLVVAKPGKRRARP